MRVTVLAGGVGGSRLAHGFALLAEEREGSGDDALQVSVIVNTADDFEVHGLHVSPDLDTVMYTLAGIASTETGWGLRDETWSAAGMLERYRRDTWFRLGDRDLGTQLARTGALGRGVPLTHVTAELSSALGVRTRILPMSDAPVRTKVRTDEGWLTFQDYFVRRGHRDEVRELRYEGAEEAAPTAAVVLAVLRADAIVIAPSNPFLSIGPILSLPGMLDALRTARAPIAAVSPIVAGAALRGPADRLFTSLGGEPSALGFVRHYAERYPRLVRAVVIDWRDADAVRSIEQVGPRVLATQTVMRDEDDRRTLARQVLDFATKRGRPSRRAGARSEERREAPDGDTPRDAPSTGDGPLEPTAARGDAGIEPVASGGGETD